MNPCNPPVQHNMKISIEAKKVLQNLIPLYDKNCQYTRNRQELPQTHKNRTANIVLIGEGPNAFPLKLGTKQGCHSHYSYSI